MRLPGKIQCCTARDLRGVAPIANVPLSDPGQTADGGRVVEVKMLTGRGDPQSPLTSGVSRCRRHGIRIPEETSPESGVERTLHHVN
jgi:hypothetical protein